ncbi:MAG: hypothetical protein RsTaC01_0143 [Candidatus Paraimprobicoccus trichonymphae]|uniref:Uncharacterized protein n=1 Tax=Candidatus Paraimprobicoccus trichonymphae TaxID=3033793 RepID=A0AA48KZ10_9FIRM|nr:MAG: hypothetical protein RsTaC01_0143 [Candidatus Paraimprobicoccus trichonymphae]
MINAEDYINFLRKVKVLYKGISSSEIHESGEVVYRGERTLHSLYQSITEKKFRDLLEISVIDLNNVAKYLDSEKPTVIQNSVLSTSTELSSTNEFSCGGGLVWTNYVDKRY